MKKKLALVFLFVIALFFPNCVLAQTATITTVNPNPTTAVAPTTLSVPSKATNSQDPSTPASTSILPSSTGSTSNSSAPANESSMVKEEGKNASSSITPAANLTLRSDWPFMAALKVNGDRICNGALINESFIITAARCVYFLSNWEISKLRAILGFNNLKDFDGTLEMEIESIVIHDDFRPRYSANDIALLKLKKAMNISNYDAVDKIEIHKNCSFDDFLFSNINKGGQVTAIGWSLLPLLKPTDEVRKIQQLNISVVLNNVECSRFGGLYVGGEKPNSDGFLCALNPPMPLYQELSTNNTMNGAAVVYRSNATSPWFLIGLVSGGLPEWCYWKSAWLYPSKCYRSYPPYGIYITSVPANRQWIKNFQCE